MRGKNSILDSVHVLVSLTTIYVGSGRSVGPRDPFFFFQYGGGNCVVGTFP
jgi:hypothetical protein